jgi:oligopeptide/dipeptide ABC transporter ATP-binding protein
VTRCGASTLPRLRLPEAILTVRGLSKHFATEYDFLGRPKQWLSAVDDVDLDVYEGKTLALVGESGCGKSTLARLIVRLIPATSGSVRFAGLDVLTASPLEMRSFRHQAQLIFQDPYGSLDPRMKVGRSVMEGVAGEALGRRERRARLEELLDLVGLHQSASQRYPHEFSGGQRQRIAIARALAVRPRLIIADEPSSALDMSVQSSILNLLTDLQRELRLTYLFISHDMSVVRHISDEVAVMYLGRIVETTTTEELFNNPVHPYTQALLSSVPSLSRRAGSERIVLRGEVAAAPLATSGCRFAPRCFRSIERCIVDDPRLEQTRSTIAHRAACWNPDYSREEMSLEDVRTSK